MRTTHNRRASKSFRMLCALGVFALLLGFAPAALIADEATEGDDGTVTEEPLSTKLSIDFKDKPIAEIAQMLSKISGRNIIVEEGLTARVSLTMPNPIEWDVALNIIVDRIHSHVQERADGTMVIIQLPTFDIYAEDLDIRNVLYAIAKTSKKNIVIEGDITGKISFNLTDVDWLSALYTVAKAGGYVVVEEDAGDDIIYRVASPDRLKSQAETKVFRLTYLRPPEDYEAQINSAFADRTDGPNATGEGAAGDGFKLKAALSKVLSEYGSLAYDEITNSFIVTDIKPKLDAIEAMIKRIDVQPVQVAVDVKFVLTSNDDLFDAGVDWRNGFTASLSGGSTLSNFPFRMGSFGLSGLQVFRNTRPNTKARVGATGIGFGSDRGAILDPDQDGDFDTLPFNFGTLDFTQMQMILKLFKRDSQSEIVQQPRLLTLDNKKATIFVGRTTHYAETHAASNQNGGLTFTQVEAANSPVRTGFQLFFVPHVIPNTNKVMMTVIPESETLVGTTSSTVSGFNVFTTEGANSQQLAIHLPDIQTQALVTTMMLESAQTAVIGGLVTTREIESVTKVPLLGDIPYLGWLFRVESHDIQKDNLLIFMTVYIIREPAKELTPLYKKYLKEQQALFPWKYKKTAQEKAKLGRWLPVDYPNANGESTEATPEGK